MFSAGMLTAFASATIVRSRGFISGSPPPLRAATVNSLMTRVNTLPRFASAAPFLCLMVCHLEWPDMAVLPEKTGRIGREILTDGECCRLPASSAVHRLQTPGSGPLASSRLPAESSTRPGVWSQEPGAVSTDRLPVTALRHDQPHI